LEPSNPLGTVQLVPDVRNTTLGLAQAVGVAVGVAVTVAVAVAVAVGVAVVVAVAVGVLVAVGVAAAAAGIEVPTSADRISTHPATNKIKERRRELPDLDNLSLLGFCPKWFLATSAMLSIIDGPRPRSRNERVRTLILACDSRPRN
jgi:hypothetical protein